MTAICRSVISGNTMRINKVGVSREDNALFKEEPEYFQDIYQRGMTSVRDGSAKDSEMRKIDLDGTAGNGIVSLNVGGKVFQVEENTIKSRGYGLLSQLSTNDESYNASTESYFFDRNPKIFAAILECYRTGKFHIRKCFCAVELEEEMKYWDVEEDCISDCCWRRFCDLQEERCQNNRVLREFTDVCQVTLARMKGLSRRRERIWVTLDDPAYSRTATGILLAYVFLVLVSFLNSCVLSFILGQGVDPLESHQGSSDNYTLTLERRTMMTLKVHLHFVEIACLSLLTSFVLIRAVVCPDKVIFWRSPLNVLDTLYLILSWPLSVIFTVNSSFRSIIISVDITGVIGHIGMIVGLLRIFRAVRHHRGIRELWYAIRASCLEVRLLSIFALLSVIIFGTLFDCAEMLSVGGPDNIFLSFWWALVTMTTLGYGDVVPSGPAGYIVASFCAFIGLVMISLPIPFITHNYNLYYGYKCRFRNK